MKRQLYLAAYDIADPRRLSRFHRWLSKRAVMLQYSVYLVRLGKQELEEVVSSIGQRINPAEDDVRIYPLPERCEADFLGVRRGMELLLSSDHLLVDGEVR